MEEDIEQEVIAPQEVETETDLDRDVLLVNSSASSKARLWYGLIALSSLLTVAVAY